MTSDCGDIAVTDNRAAFVAHLAMEVMKMKTRDISLSVEEVVIREVYVLRTLQQIPACFQSVLKEVISSNRSQKLIIEEVCDMIYRAENESE